MNPQINIEEWERDMLWESTDGCFKTAHSIHFYYLKMSILLLSMIFLWLIIAIETGFHVLYFENDYKIIQSSVFKNDKYEIWNTTLQYYDPLQGKYTLMKYQEQYCLDEYQTVTWSHINETIQMYWVNDRLKFWYTFGMDYHDIGVKLSSIIPCCIQLSCGMLILCVILFSNLKKDNEILRVNRLFSICSIISMIPVFFVCMIWILHIFTRIQRVEIVNIDYTRPTNVYTFTLKNRDITFEIIQTIGCRDDALDSSFQNGEMKWIQWKEGKWQIIDYDSISFLYNKREKCQCVLLFFSFVFSLCLLWPLPKMKSISST